MTELINTFEKFLSAVMRRWWALMSCALFTFAAWYGAAHGKSNEWYVKCSSWLAVFVLVWATFLAWREQHLAVQERDRRIRMYEDKTADLIWVSKATWDGCYLSGSAPGDDATDDQVEKWKQDLDKWRHETSEMLFSISPIGANKFAHIHRLSDEPPYGAHKSIWGELNILNIRIDNLTQILEKPNIYLAKIV